jgi:hypothetical protein
MAYTLTVTCVIFSPSQSRSTSTHKWLILAIHVAIFRSALLPCQLQKINTLKVHVTCTLI